MFTPEVARNFAGPAVVASCDWRRTVLDTVSMVLAVAYVPKYRADIKRKGREVRKRWGRMNRVPSEERSEVLSGRRPEAFSMIALSVRISEVLLGAKEYEILR